MNNFTVKARIVQQFIGRLFTLVSKLCFGNAYSKHSALLYKMQSVQGKNSQLEANLGKEYKDLIIESWKLGGYRSFTIYEPKHRKVFTATRM